MDVLTLESTIISVSIGQIRCFLMMNSFLAGGHFFFLLIIFANDFDPDQDQHYVSPDLDPKHLTL